MDLTKAVAIRGVTNMVVGYSIVTFNRSIENVLQYHSSATLVLHRCYPFMMELPVM